MFSLAHLIRERGFRGKVIVSAEIGLNHNGELEIGKQCIRAAADCGVQAVKFQNWRTGDFVKNKNEEYTYNCHGFMENGVTETLWKMFSRHELCFEELQELKAEADRSGLLFHSTPSGKTGILDLQRLDCQVMKIASDGLADSDLVHDAMERDMSLVVSTGMLSVKEVQEMLRPGFGSRACPEVAVLHCVRKYPTPKWEANLPRIAELRQAMEEIGFRPALVGYSDHTQGLESAVDAVEHYGACWIEKHFTLDRKMVGPDHWFSADPEEMGKLVRCLN